MVFGDASFAEAVVAPGGLVAAKGHAGGAGVVVDAGVFGEGAPAAADVEQGVALLQADLLADYGELVVLKLLEGLLVVDVRDNPAGVDHAWTEEPAIEVVTAVVVVADLFFV